MLKKLKQFFSKNVPTEPTMQPSQPTSEVASAPSSDITPAPTLTQPSDPAPAPPLTQTSDPAPVPPLAPVLPLQQLSQITQTISSLPPFQLLGSQLEAALQDPSVTQTHLTAIMSHADALISQELSKLEQLRNTLATNTQPSSEITTLTHYHKLITEMTHLPQLTPQLDHENLAESNIVSTVQSLVKYVSVLENLTQHLTPEHIQALQSLSQPTKDLGTQFASFVNTFKQFKSAEETLRQEIIAYSNALTQIQQQNPNSPDYGGKKPLFEQKAAELTSRREAYVKDEETINYHIQSFSSTIAALHGNLSKLLTPLVTHFEDQLKALAAQTPSIDTTSLQSEIDALQVQIDHFIKLKAEFLSLFS